MGCSENQLAEFSDLVTWTGNEISHYLSLSLSLSLAWFLFLHILLSLSLSRHRIQVGCSLNEHLIKAHLKEAVGSSSASLRRARKAPTPRSRNLLEGSVHSGLKIAAGMMHTVKRQVVPHNRVPWRPSITAGTLKQGHIKGTVTAYAPFGPSEKETTIQTRTLRH